MEFDKYMSLYCEAKSNGAELSKDIKDYIDSKMGETGASGGKYNVVPSFQKGRLLVIDIDDGSVVGNIDPQGKLISVPVVYGDSVSFAVQDEAGRVNGTVRSLPDGAIQNNFRVGEPRPGMKYKEVMGREDEKDTDDDQALDVEPTEVPIDDEQADNEESPAEELHVAKQEMQQLQSKPVHLRSPKDKKRIDKLQTQIEDLVKNLAAAQIAVDVQKQDRLSPSIHPSLRGKPGAPADIEDISGGVAGGGIGKPRPL